MKKDFIEGLKIIQAIFMLRYKLDLTFPKPFYTEISLNNHKLLNQLKGGRK